MKTRRQFIKFTIEFLVGLGVFFSTIGLWLKKAYAQTKRIIVPKGTSMSSLRDKNPATLDTRNLEIIPLKNFETKNCLKSTDFHCALLPKIITAPIGLNMFTKLKPLRRKNR